MNDGLWGTYMTYMRRIRLLEVGSGIFSTIQYCCIGTADFKISDLSLRFKTENSPLIFLLPFYSYPALGIYFLALTRGEGILSELN